MNIKTKNVGVPRSTRRLNAVNTVPTSFLPNYFVIGAAKAASSSICTLLGQHPDVFMVECKEPCFFNEDSNYVGKGWTWYNSLYYGSEEKKMRGEGSNNYSMKEVWPDTANRIFDGVPDAKLIYIVRDPLPRIESFWKQLLANGDSRVTHDFNRSVMENVEFLVDSTNYFSQLKPYYKKFPESRIKVIFYEDFIRDSAEVMKELFDYLAVDPQYSSLQDAAHVNPSEGKLVFSPTILWIRRATWLQPMKRLFSDKWKQEVAERFFRSKLRVRPTWNRNTERFVLDRIGSDCQQLLDKHSKSRQFWPSLKRVG